MEFAHGFTYWGEKMITGRLKTMGLNISRQRVREAMYRVDPNGNRMRRRKVLKRRVYQVSAPNKLWHMDGHEKLKR